MLNQAELTILAPALLVGILTILSHVPLGIEVFKRGIIFVDIAIAQFAALGIIILNFLFPELAEENRWLSQLAAFSLAILAAGLFALSEKKYPQIQEAIIGASFVFAASLVMILLSANPHGAEHFQDILSGQILWSSWQDVFRLLLFYCPILLVWFKLHHKLSKLGFYCLFALVITNSVQIVGIYLVFSFLILPAFVSLSFKQYHKQLGFAYLASLGSLLIGLAFSSLYDLPTGPVIAVSLFLVNFGWFLFSSKKKTTAIPKK